MLELQGITQRFGGITALDDVSFTIRQGAIQGVIGPNGAGKTTLFNIISGIYSQTAGKVLFNGEDISHRPVHEFARLGIVRTFQNIELFGSLTVLENVKVGLHSRSKSGILSSMFRLPSHLREERMIEERSREALVFCGISELAPQTASSLPFGKGRILEIARAIALQPKMILMDEPAAGLNNRETRELSELIRRIRDLGVTVVLVEHDMELVMEICDRIAVLNLGTLLAEGSPREIQENQAVIAAYLGEG